MHACSGGFSARGCASQAMQTKSAISVSICDLSLVNHSQPAPRLDGTSARLTASAIWTCSSQPCSSRSWPTCFVRAFRY